MNLATNLINRTSLFWEINPNRIASVLEENDDWVIVRVFEYGTIEDIAEVIRVYGKAKVIEVLRQEKLTPIAASMAYLFLHVDRYGRHPL
ncbi:MAG: hypothetical protein KF763_04490 [Cyclobacteriaceae bacterium]|nr:hypothetical protein [Cyclobacteriaceae bacterium]